MKTILLFLFSSVAFAEKPETEHVTRDFSYDSHRDDCDGIFDLHEFGIALPGVAHHTREFMAKISNEPVEGPDLPGREQLVLSYRFVGQLCERDGSGFAFQSQSLPGEIQFSSRSWDGRASLFNSRESLRPAGVVGNVTNAVLTLPLVDVLSHEQQDQIRDGHPVALTFSANTMFVYPAKGKENNFAQEQAFVAVFYYDSATDAIQVKVRP